MIKRAVAWLFEKIYDFVTGGGLKKALVAVAVLALVGGLGMYIVYPEFTATIVANLLGADPAAEFEPVEAGAGTTYYEGAISGNAGPTGGAVDGTVLAKVNFEAGRVAGNVTGTYSGQSVSGFLQGSITDDGTTVGTGQATALSVATVKFRFNGAYNAGGTEASGTWRSTTNIRGDGEWRIERIDESEYRRLEDELFGE
jgi:hypothetical protein